MLSKSPLAYLPMSNRKTKMDKLIKLHEQTLTKLDGLGETLKTALADAIENKNREDGHITRRLLEGEILDACKKEILDAFRWENALHQQATRSPLENLNKWDRILRKERIFD
jgi:hypothetical protein